MTRLRNHDKNMKMNRLFAPLLRPSYHISARNCSQESLYGDHELDGDFKSAEAAAAYAVAKPYEEIPGPKPLPVIGNIWRYAPYIGEYSFKKLHLSYQKMNKQFGPLVRERVLGSREMVHAFDADDMYTVYGHRIEWPIRETHQALKKYRNERPDKFKNTGVFLSNGEDWESLRFKFARCMMMEDVVDKYTNALEDITDQFVEKIGKIIDEKKEVDLQPWLFKWAIECIGAIVLDRRLGCLSENNKMADKLVEAAHDTHQGIFVTEISPFYKYFKTKTYAKLEAAQEFFGSVVEKYIKDDDLGEDAMLKTFFDLKDTDYKEIYTMTLDMFLAGIDTTSYTSAFGLYNLSRCQRAQDKLREQLIERLPNTNSRLSDSIRDCVYLDSVMKESLRLNPVAFGNGRVLTQNLVLSGYKVPKGTHVIIQHQAASLNEKYFENPTEFIPERFYDKAYNQDDPLSYIASSPFGFGGRPCMGRAIAEREMLLLFGKLIRKYRISYHYDPIDCYNRLVNVPDKPLRLRFQSVSR